MQKPENRTDIMNDIPASTIKRLSSTALIMLALLIAWLVTQLFPQQSHLLILLIGASMISYSLYILHYYGRVQNWTMVKGKILSINEAVAGQMDARSPAYIHPQIEYEYQIDNRKYRNNRIALEKQNIWCAEMNLWGKPIQQHEKWWSALKTGYELSVYVDPEKHQNSVLIKSLKNSRRSHHMAVLFGGILICVVWFLVLLITI